ncbi:FAD binding domain-containing protein [Talaromyces proteolyticus]|uniref:FAD binding domain-containing protein n=1 Tax=Talaromyces proteolyticus TaxID=1131652 RepID=A0AAD4KXQ7_9EURO|nr:FAD binding domain-containing protein [Talaromyces proteolyticus]KAH8702190.1 FAD binding domain-containing protein [Talaromyces proteolyticus]
MALDIKQDLVARLSISSAVIIAGDEGWESAIGRWTRYRTEVPAAVVQPITEEDVILTISYLVYKDLPFKVRGGGHSNGFSTIASPGVVLDLSRMRKVTVDVERQVVVAQGGATMGDGINAAASVGFAVATGTCNEVGLVGATLGGGIGRFLGLLGYSTDTVISMRIAVVDETGKASIVEASAKTEKDLFWGLRGYGHLFAVVVEATFKAIPWEHLTWHTTLVFDPSQIGLISEELDKVHCHGGMQGRLVFCAPPPDGKPLVLLQLWYIGPPEEAAGKFSTLLDLPSKADHPLNFIGHLIPYKSLNDSSKRICAYAGRKNLSAFGMKALSAESGTVALKVFTDFIAKHPEAAQTHILIEFYSMDVASELDKDGTETSLSSEFRRDVKYWVMPLAWYSDPALDDDCATLNKDIREAFLTTSAGNQIPSVSYVNMPFEDATASQIVGSKERLEKLQALKAKWDPLGVIKGVIPLS